MTEEVPELTSDIVEGQKNERQVFEEFKAQIMEKLTNLENESKETEALATKELQLNSKVNSQSQFLLAEVNEFEKELDDLKNEMSEAQK